MKRYLTLILSLTISICSLAQTTVKGVIRDTKGEPVIGAAVMLKSDASVASVSDLDGNYSLRIPASDRDPVLTVSCLSYNSQEIKVEGRAVIDIVLEEDSEELDEAVVVGYGSMRRSDLTGSVASVKVSESEASHTTSLGQLLQGHASGVQVVANNASPDAAVSVRIRGLGSFNGSNEPLYVIDGVILNPASQTESLLTVGTDNAGTDEAVNGLLGLSPQDIESMEILKDASATAIYGAMGANGVILITTKTAKKDRPTVEFTAGVDLSQRYKKQDILSFDEYVTLLERQEEAGISTTGFLQQLYDDPATRTGLKVTPMDWQDYVFRTAVSQRYNLLITGRPSSLSYALSINYTDRQGVVKCTDTKMLSVRLNIDKAVTSNFRIGTKSNFAYVYSDQSQNSGKATAATSLIRSVLSFRPYTSLNPDDETEDESEDIDNNSRSGPDRWLNDFVNQRKEYRITPSFYASYKFLDYFTVKSTIGGDYRDSERLKFKSSRINSTAEGSTGAIGNYKYLNWNWDNIFQYKQKIRSHNITAMIGASLNSSLAQVQTVQGWNILQYRALADAITTAPNSSLVYSEGKNTTLSFFARGTYSWRDRYVLTATCRFDGSSKFQGRNKWSTFPSLAFAWRMNEEPWFNAYSISQLKLRFGWGMVGNQAIDRYQTLSNYVSTSYADHSVYNPSEYSVGIAPENISNPDLKWETTEQANVGIDFAMWQGRMALSVDAYRKVTYNLLQEKKIATSSGFTTMWVNEGNIRNLGLEISLDATPVKLGDFEWAINGNISFNRNKILYISDTASTGQIYTSMDKSINAVYFLGNSMGSSTYGNEPATIFMEGYPMGLFYGYKTDGIVQEGEAGPAIVKGGKLASAGHLRMIDTNCNGYIDQDDRMIIGNPNPDFTFGFGTTFYYKGLSVSASFNGSYGNDILNINMMRETDTTTKNHNVARAAMYDSWTPDNPGAKYWGIGMISSTETRAVKDIDIEDGSYIRLANLSASYDIPFKKNSKILRGVSVGFTGSNLVFWTKYSGWDPEVNSFGSDMMRMGADSGSYPSARTYSFDVKFTF